MKKSSVVKTLAFDTSSTNTGFSYFENGIFKSSGSIVSKHEELWQRVDDMISKLAAFIYDIKPDIVVIEELDVDNNHKVNSAHSEIIGAIEGVVTLYNLINKENCIYWKFPPSAWRKLVNTENEKLPRKRKELKVWDVKRANEMAKIYHFCMANKSDDNEADAILIGYAYIFYMQEICSLNKEKQNGQYL